MKAISKAIIIAAFLFFIIGTIGALDTASSQFLQHLVNLRDAGPPEVFDDSVLFTSPPYKRVGIAFAHEGFSKVYWFQKLIVLDDSPDPQSEENIKKIPPLVYKEAGILFYVYTAPKNLEVLEYRLIINGLWTADPQNPVKRIDESGVARSVMPLPKASKPPSPVDDLLPGYVTFRYRAPSGESVFVAGSFNNWDPFMYELKEETPGNYALTLPLPTGTYQYAFFHRGERFLDADNLMRVYRDRRPVSQIVVP